MVEAVPAAPQFPILNAGTAAPGGYLGSFDTVLAYVR